MEFQALGCAGGVVAPTLTMAQVTNYPTGEAIANLRQTKKVLTKLNLVTHGTPTAPGFFLNEIHDEIIRVDYLDL